MPISDMPRARVGGEGAENQKTSVNHALVNVFCSYGISENHNVRKPYSKVRLLPVLRFLMKLPTRAREEKG